MNFIRELKSLEFITSKQNTNVTTYTRLKEDEKTISIRFIEHMPEFSRGFVCDIEHKYKIINEDGKEIDKELVCLSHDLVLVYIYKIVHIDSIPEFEYVFYK